MTWEAKRRWSAFCLPLAGHRSSTPLNVLNWQARVNRQLSWALAYKWQEQLREAAGAARSILLLWKAPSRLLQPGPGLQHKNLSNHHRLSVSNGHSRVGSLFLHEPRGRQRRTNQQIKPMAYHSGVSAMMTLKSRGWKWISVQNSRRSAITASPIWHRLSHTNIIAAHWLHTVCSCV